MKNILIVGCGFAGRTVLTQAVNQGMEIDIITPEEAKERGLTITTNTEPPFPYKLTHVAPISLQGEPQTRKDRRKQKRSKRKKRK